MSKKSSRRRDSRRKDPYLFYASPQYVGHERPPSTTHCGIRWTTATLYRDRRPDDCLATDRRRRGSAAEYPRTRLVSPRPSVSSLSSSATTPRGAIRVRIPCACIHVCIRHWERTRARARRPSGAKRFRTRGCLAHVSLQASCQTLRKEPFKSRVIFCAHGIFRFEILLLIWVLVLQLNVNLIEAFELSFYFLIGLLIEFF